MYFTKQTNKQQLTAKKISTQITQTKTLKKLNGTITNYIIIINKNNEMTKAHKVINQTTTN